MRDGHKWEIIAKWFLNSLFFGLWKDEVQISENSACLNQLGQLLSWQVHSHTDNSAIQFYINMVFVQSYIFCSVVVIFGMDDFVVFECLHHCIFPHNCVLPVSWIHDSVFHTLIENDFDWVL